jgi:hypothetical protein
MKTLTVSGIVPRNYPGGVTMTDATSATSATPTAVFVHGAWADATGFGGVIRALGDRGFTAIGMANPCVDRRPHQQRRSS